MRKKWLIVAALVTAIIALFVWFRSSDVFRGVRPVLSPPPANISVELKKNGSGPLRLPEGFSLEVVAEDAAGARVLAFDPDGNLWVSQISRGSLTKYVKRDGRFAVAERFDGFKNPHGLAFDPKNPRVLYMAEETRISKTSIDGALKWEKVVDLPAGGRHVSRTIRFGPDGRLYVVVGSTCDVCIEKDPRISKVHVVENGQLKEFARGLRNAVFIAFHPETGKLWATEMGRDQLGDETPPDEVDIIEDGKNYGWPICYGKNIHDSRFDKKVYIRNPCMEPFETPSFIDIPAHSAPLGLAFAPQSWPEEYRGDLFVAYHGSWNRSEPTGYKVVRMRLDENGNYVETLDFIDGWLTNSAEALGRPVDILIGPDEAMYISDDKAGVVYRVAPVK